MTTEAEKQVMHNGLKILARMIARVYLKDVARSKGIEIEEEGNADQGSQPTHQVAEAEEDQPGNDNLFAIQEGR